MVPEAAEQTRRELAAPSRRLFCLRASLLQRGQVSEIVRVCHRAECRQPSRGLVHLLLRFLSHTGPKNYL